jgi:putative transposase
LRPDRASDGSIQPPGSTHGRPTGRSSAWVNPRPQPAPALDYAEPARVRRVRRCGAIKWRGAAIFIRQALIGEPVGLFPIADDVWLVKYGPVVLGPMKGARRLHPHRAGTAVPARCDPEQNTQPVTHVFGLTHVSGC